VAAELESGGAGQCVVAAHLDDAGGGVAHVGSAGPGVGAVQIKDARAADAAAGGGGDIRSAGDVAADGEGVDAGGAGGDADEGVECATHCVAVKNNVVVDGRGISRDVAAHGERSA